MTEETIAQFHKIIKRFRKNVPSFAKFMHEVSHAFTVEELQLMLDHAQGVDGIKPKDTNHTVTETVTNSKAATDEERLAELVTKTEEFLKDLRENKFKIPFDELDEVVIEILIKGN